MGRTAWPVGPTPNPHPQKKDTQPDPCTHTAISTLQNFDSYLSFLIPWIDPANFGMRSVLSNNYNFVNFKALKSVPLWWFTFFFFFAHRRPFKPLWPPPMIVMLFVGLHRPGVPFLGTAWLFLKILSMYKRLFAYVEPCTGVENIQKMMQRLSWYRSWMSLHFAIYKEWFIEISNQR